MKTKLCSKCHTNKPITLFYVDKRKRDGLYPHCKSCHRKMCNSWGDKHGGIKLWQQEYNKRMKGTKISIARIYSKKKYNALHSNIPFDIDKDEFISWYLSTKQKCVYCGLEQENIIKHKHLLPNTNAFYLSLDRMDNSRGYSIDNICLACTRCNLIKSNFFSYDEMIEIGQKYVKPKWN